tara:strand:+ start:956 stop:1222 length:267 start_codon:yes stop_codon:yes gene_type:complete
MATATTKEGTKFSKEEMETVAKVKERYNEITVRLGQLQIEQNVLDEQKETVQDMYKEIRKSEIDFVQELSKKYGQGQLDLDTGVFIPA